VGRGIIALVAVLGLSVLACDNPTDSKGGGNNPGGRNNTSDNNPYVGTWKSQDNFVLVFTGDGFWTNTSPTGGRVGNGTYSLSTGSTASMAGAGAITNVSITVSGATSSTYATTQTLVFGGKTYTKS